MSPSIESRIDEHTGSGNAVLTELLPRVTSADLLRGRRKLIIEHGESTYVLLLTRNGKLILNK